MSKSPFPRTFHPHLPGVTVAWLAHVNGVTPETIRRWRRTTQRDDPAIGEFMAQMTLELAARMARLRPGRSLLPFWSRLAIAEYHRMGTDYDTLSRLFRCSRNTIWRALKHESSAFHTLTGERRLTHVQAAPFQAGDRN